MVLGAYPRDVPISTMLCVWITTGSSWRPPSMHCLLWFTFVTFLILWFLSPAASSVSWYRSSLVCSGVAYEIYSVGDPSTYVYCVVCYRVIVSPHVRRIGHVFTLLMTIRNALWTMKLLYSLTFFLWTWIWHVRPPFVIYHAHADIFHTKLLLLCNHLASCDVYYICNYLYIYNEFILLFENVLHYKQHDFISICALSKNMSLDIHIISWDISTAANLNDLKDISLQHYLWY